MPRVKKKMKASKGRKFHLGNGVSCKDLLQLADEIDRMSLDDFQHYVNEVDNHFANWVEHVFKDDKLAKLLKDTKSKDRHVIELLRVSVK
jgi:hypothetical protein